MSNTVQQAPRRAKLPDNSLLSLGVVSASPNTGDLGWLLKLIEAQNRITSAWVIIKKFP